MTGAYRNQVARSLLGVVLSSSIVLASAPAAWAQQPMAPPAAQPLPPPPPPGAAPAPLPGSAPAQPGGYPGAAPAQPGAYPGAAPATPVPPGPAVGAPPAGDVGPTDVTTDAPVVPKGSGYTNSKVPAYVAFGVAGVGLVAGTIFGISALSAKSDYKDDPTYMPNPSRTARWRPTSGSPPSSSLASRARSST